MQVPPIFYKSTNIVLHENHKGICSGRMVPTPKIYGIGSWTKKYKTKSTEICQFLQLKKNLYIVCQP